MWSFLRGCSAVVSKRALLFVVLNWLFFGSLLVGAFVAESGAVRAFRWSVGAEVFSLKSSNVVLLVVSIFFFNLVVSGFVLVTLTGLALFVLPFGFLSVRAFLWGRLLEGLSTPLFLAALPTLILEGEGYVMASLAGIILGLSWLKPRWMYKGEELSRSRAVKMAFQDSARIYVWVGVLLLMGTIVEAMTLIFIF